MEKIRNWIGEQFGWVAATLFAVVGASWSYFEVWPALGYNLRVKAALFMLFSSCILFWVIWAILRGVPKGRQLGLRCAFLTLCCFSATLIAGWWYLSLDASFKVEGDSIVQNRIYRYLMPLAYGVMSAFAAAIPFATLLALDKQFGIAKRLKKQ